MDISRMIFFNIGWMEKYDGISTDVNIVNGGQFIQDHNFGGEVYNFRDCNGSYYGYVETKGSKDKPQQKGKITLSSIVSNTSDKTECLEGVTCVFTAKSPSRGRQIIGWYLNATVYSKYQEYNGNDRELGVPLDIWGDQDSNQVGYYAVASAENGNLLTIDERQNAPAIPHSEGYMGQNNVWYASSEQGLEMRRIVCEYIDTYLENNQKEKDVENSRQKQAKRDIESKKRVEECAIKRTITYYEKYGFTYKSVESENLGWDLEFIKGKEKLFVEVKGLSQSNISVQLTTNEYEKMLEHKQNYKLSVVTGCRDGEEPAINIFSYVFEKDGWYDQYDNVLNITEIVMARCEA